MLLDFQRAGGTTLWVRIVRVNLRNGQFRHSILRQHCLPLSWRLEPGTSCSYSTGTNTSAGLHSNRAPLDCNSDRNSGNSCIASLGLARPGGIRCSSGERMASRSRARILFRNRPPVLARARQRRRGAARWPCARRCLFYAGPQWAPRGTHFSGTSPAIWLVWRDRALGIKRARGSTARRPSHVGAYGGRIFRDLPLFSEPAFCAGRPACSGSCRLIAGRATAVLGTVFSSPPYCV
jgi:hypothetical protein